MKGFSDITKLGFCVPLSSKAETKQNKDSKLVKGWSSVVAIFDKNWKTMNKPERKRADSSTRILATQIMLLSWAIIGTSMNRIVILLRTISQFLDLSLQDKTKIQKFVFSPWFMFVIYFLVTTSRVVHWIASFHQILNISLQKPQEQQSHYTL